MTSLFRMLGCGFSHMRRSRNSVAFTSTFSRFVEGSPSLYCSVFVRHISIFIEFQTISSMFRTSNTLVFYIYISRWTTGYANGCWLPYMRFSSNSRNFSRPKVILACKVRVISERTFIYLIFVFAKNKTYDFSQDETISSSTFVVEHGTSLRWEILPLGIVVEPPKQLLITRACVSSNSPCKTW